MKNKQKNIAIIAYSLCVLLKRIQKELPQSAGILKDPRLADIGVMVTGYCFLRNRREQMKWFELGAGISLIEDMFGAKFMPYARIVLC
jgi:hypothetical protein